MAVHPVRELRAFVLASLAVPVARDHRESPSARRRRRIVVTLTLLVGAAVLGFSLRIPPGDPAFYWATLLLAGVWVAGALLAGPLHAGWATTREGTHLARPLVQPLVWGALLLALFTAGALGVARLPALRDPVDQLLDHARHGSLALIVLITIINGVAEELYFRGALYAAMPRARAVPYTAVLYAVATAASGVPLLAFAGLVLGVVTGLQRRVTGGVLAPIVTHVTWTLGMLLILPVILNDAR